MIPLAPKFRSRGFDWEIVQREGDVAIISQHKTGWSSPVYNVVLIQKHKAHKWPDGTLAPEREGMPNWEQWGEFAWTGPDKASAKARFNALVDAYQNADPRPPVLPKTGSEGQNSTEIRRIISSKWEHEP